MNETKKKWLQLAPAGILLMGFGLSVIGEATGMKIQGGSTWEWVLWGTGGLAAFFAGLSLFGQAVVLKGQLDADKRKQQRK
ncbi:hypothetical protein A3SI_18036 [Nitritalea halalkaliphila LW7]|uniref:Uncharacterized protein n=1 Tax=Nitritalea halalkaliphila LW7 TaxID=1189621 RepID=I5BV18_9BACT|nr:hypothetical protein [Nitritalea halalkaliphila]EIM73420.1 hypothetical protein A3SI_18036 [Nitritalea halalkaliphila LW7]